METQTSSTNTAFEAIGISLTRALQRGNGTYLAASQFAIEFFSNRKKASPGGTDPLFKDLEEESVHFLLFDLRRYNLLAAVSAFDTFLSDATRFLLLTQPAHVDEILSASKKRKLEQAIPVIDERVPEIVRRHLKTWEARLDFLVGVFGLQEEIAPSLDRLRPHIHLRNEIVHQSGLYDFLKDTKDGEIFANARPVPEVTNRQSGEVIMLVTLVTDQILEALALNLFGALPRVRPMTPALRTHYDRQEIRWQQEDSAPTPRDVVGNPNWHVTSMPNKHDVIFVDEATQTFRVLPTNIDQVPALFSVLKKTRHGVEPTVRVDDGPARRLSGASTDLLSEMLVGKQIQIEIQEELAEYPRIICLSLAGFRAAWDEGVDLKSKST